MKDKDRNLTVLIWLLRCMKYAVAMILFILFCVKCLEGFVKLGEKLMTFSSSTGFDPVFTYPSITICITMDTNFTGGTDNTEWIPEDKYSFTFPFSDLGIVCDAHITKVKGDDMNSIEILNEVNIGVDDVWETHIYGLFGEPNKCYTYKPLGSRAAGFGYSLQFRLKSRSDPSIAVNINVHNDQAYVPNLSRIFGNDYAIVFARANQMTSMSYEMTRQNITDINTEDRKCSHKPELYVDDQPGLVDSPQGPKTLQQCVLDHYHKNLGCRMPWAKNDSLSEHLAVCTTTEQFIRYKNITRQLDKSSDVTYFDTINCTPRCSYTSYSLRQMFDSNYDSLVYENKTSDGANIQVSFLFPKSEVTILTRTWIYDNNAFIADVGGFLGLLLGASCFTLADLFTSYLQHLLQKNK